MSVEVALGDAAWTDVDAGVEALLDEWLVAEGDSVHPGQPLARVVLVKATLEVEAPAAGRVAKRLVAAGATFARGAPLALLDPA